MFSQVSLCDHFFLHLEPVFGLENSHKTVEGAPPRSKFSKESKSFFKIKIFPMVAERRRATYFVAGAGKKRQILIIVVSKNAPI